MFENFTTLAYLLSFPGMIAVVILLTNFTKNLFDKLFLNSTKYIVCGWSIVFSLVAFIYLGKFESWKTILESIVVWLVNSVIVWFSAMKAFELGAERLVK